MGIANAVGRELWDSVGDLEKNDYAEADVMVNEARKQVWLRYVGCCHSFFCCVVAYSAMQTGSECIQAFTYMYCALIRLCLCLYQFLGWCCGVSSVSLCWRRTLRG